jgi:hypothetical protein
MARQQRLKLTLRDRVGGGVWKHQALVVTADPEDVKTLVGYVIQMARDPQLANRGGGEPWWAEQYAARVEGLDETWRDFEVIGGGA